METFIGEVITFLIRFVLGILYFVLFIIFSVFIVYSFLVFALVDVKWRDALKQSKKEKLSNNKKRSLFVILMYPFTMSARFILTHFFPMWQKILEKYFTFGY